jgi:hypothetical protein
MSTLIKGVLYIGLGLIVFVLAVGAFNSDDKDTASAPATEGVKKLINDEVKIKDATLTSARVLYVAVNDDGTGRDGYASYVCSVLTDYKIDAVKVKVVQYGSMNSPKADNSYGILLGESQCK